jgi:hypothetical protein
MEVKMKVNRVALVFNLDGRWLQMDFDNGCHLIVNVDAKAKELFNLIPTVQSQQAEICSDKICSYCRMFGDCTFCKNYSNFRGRKLLPC